MIEILIKKKKEEEENGKYHKLYKLSLLKYKIIQMMMHFSFLTMVFYILDDTYLVYSQYFLNFWF